MLINVISNFVSGLKAKSEEIVKKAKEDKELSIFEKYLEKRKEKKKLKRRKGTDKEEDKVAEDNQEVLFS